MEKRLKIGDWIIADIIGLGFYEIVNIDDVHIQAKLLRLFDGKNPNWKGHVTCITVSGLAMLPNTNVKLKNKT
jgi:hypothetical protein